MACHYEPYLDRFHKQIGGVHTNDGNKSALLIIDVQNAFLPDGSLQVLLGLPDQKQQCNMMINNIITIMM